MKVELTDEVRKEIEWLCEAAWATAKMSRYQSGADNYRSAAKVVRWWLDTPPSDGEGWKRFGDEKPRSNLHVLFCGTPSFHHITIAFYTDDAKQWDHDNWHGPKIAHPDDLWRPLPAPPTAEAPR
jgi:hypothetical protein